MTTPENIINTTARYYGIDPETIAGRERNQSVSYPRHVAMYLMCEHTHLSLKEIGELFDSRHHATIIHGRNRIRGEMGAYSKVKSEVSALSERLMA